MGKLKNNNDGFSAVEVVLVLVIVALIGVVGWMVYKNHHKTTSTTTSTATKTTSKPKTTSAAPVQYTSFVNVIQDDSTVTQATPDKVAKTSDQTSILAALHGSCSGQTDNYVTVNHAVFDGSTNFQQEGNYARINAGICTPLAKSLDDVGGSGANQYLHKTSAGKWTFDASSQSEPECSKVDGLGYPTDMISSCSDGSVSRAPKQ